MAKEVVYINGVEFVPRVRTHLASQHRPQRLYCAKCGQMIKAGIVGGTLLEHWKRRHIKLASELLEG